MLVLKAWLKFVRADDIFRGWHFSERIFGSDPALPAGGNHIKVGSTEQWAGLGGKRWAESALQINKGKTKFLWNLEPVWQNAVMIIIHILKLCSKSVFVQQFRIIPMTWIIRIIMEEDVHSTHCNSCFSNTCTSPACPTTACPNHCGVRWDIFAKVHLQCQSLKYRLHSCKLPDHLSEICPLQQVS